MSVAGKSYISSEDTVKVVAFAVSKGLSENRLFDLNAVRDGALERFHLLKLELIKRGVQCLTLDMINHDKVDILVCSDILSQTRDVIFAVRSNPQVKIIYIPTEPPVISCLHILSVLKMLPFDRILTWNDDFVNYDERAIKCNIGQPVINVRTIPSVPFETKKFLVAITSSKLVKHKNGLHKERYIAFEFFSKKQLTFDLFGTGWDKINLNYIKKTYRGLCDVKKDTLKDYKFSICFENATGYPGLITEKIFDCFAAGTIPIYYGPPNASEYIPDGCYINFCDYESYDKLYDYLSQLSHSEYQIYLDAAKNFLKSSKYHEFTSVKFSEIVIGQVMELLQEQRIDRSAYFYKWAFLKIIVAHPLVFLRNIVRCRHYLRDLFILN